MTLLTVLPAFQLPSSAEDVSLLATASAVASTSTASTAATSASFLRGLSVHRAMGAAATFGQATSTVAAAAVSASASSISKAPVASPNAKEDQDWPFVLIIMLLVALAVYVLLVSPTLIKGIASNNWRRGRFLRSSPTSVEMAKLPYPRPSRPTNRFLAFMRGYYNRLLLPTIPYLRLTVGQCLVLLVYLGCVVAATFSQAGNPQDDVIRSGRIAVAQLPVLFALATKNNIFSWIGKSYAKLNFIHRFAGRSVIVCSAVHSGLYLRKFVVKRTVNFEGNHVQLTGLAAMCIATFIFLTSLPPVRKYAYQTFLVSHILGWIALVVAIYMHVAYARPWIMISLAIIILDYILRLAGTRIRTATLIPSIEGGVTQIRVDGIKSGWKAGQHVWVRRMNAKHVFEVHPFSIANAAELDVLRSKPKGLTLYAKSCGDWTKDLHTAAKPDPEAGGISEKRTEPKQIQLSIDGPYGGNLDLMKETESVMLVAGGSGITFALNALEDLIACSIAGNCCTRRIKFIYIVRNIAPVKQFLRVLESLAEIVELRSFLDLEIQVYDTAIRPTLSLINPFAALAQQQKKSQASIRMRQGRPNLVTCLNHFLNDARPAGKDLGGGVALASCGPAALIDTVRQSARLCDQNLAYRAGGVAVHSETFGW